MSTRGIINANNKVRRNLFMEQGRRQISNNPSRRSGNYRSSKQAFKQKAAAFLGAGIILGGVGVGIGKTVISNMAEKANYNKDLQTAIDESGNELNINHNYVYNNTADGNQKTRETSKWKM